MLRSFLNSLNGANSEGQVASPKVLILVDNVPRPFSAIQENYSPNSPTAMLRKSSSDSKLDGNSCLFNLFKQHQSYKDIHIYEDS